MQVAFLPNESPWLLSAAATDEFFEKTHAERERPLRHVLLDRCDCRLLAGLQLVAPVDKAAVPLPIERVAHGLELLSVTHGEKSHSVTDVTAGVDSPR